MNLVLLNRLLKKVQYFKGIVEIIIWSKFLLLLYLTSSNFNPTIASPFLQHWCRHYLQYTFYLFLIRLPWWKWAYLWFLNLWYWLYTYSCCAKETLNFMDCIWDIFKVGLTHPIMGAFMGALIKAFILIIGNVWIVQKIVSYLVLLNKISNNSNECHK